MKKRSSLFRLIMATTLVVVFALPSLSHAATVCCACKQTTDPNKATSCLLIDTSIISRTEDCPTIPANTTLGTDWTCEKTTDTECRRIFDGGVCLTAPQASSLEKKTTAGSGDTIGTSNESQSMPAMAIPDFNTPIPTFVAPQDGGLLLGAYIVAIYRYGLSIGVIAATVMFIWGGFIYLVGSSGAASIKKGRDIMMDSIIGLILLFSANLILRTLNPSLTTLKTLNITAIQTEEIVATDFIIDTKTGYRTPIVAGSTGNECLLSNFGRSDAEIGKRMVTVTFLGNKLMIHQLAAPDFQSALQEIESADPGSPTGEWIAKMKRMAPYEASCGKGKGYPDRGSQIGGSYNPKLDQGMRSDDPSKKPCLSCHMHWLGLAIDLDSCFNPMCPSGMTCRLTDPKINRIPKDVVDIFAKHRIYWGGYGWSQAGKDWNAAVTGRDAMHFEWHGRCWNF